MPNPSVQHVGVFHLSTDKVVVIDPGYTIDTASVHYGGFFVDFCRTGEWHARLTMEIPGNERTWAVPHFLVATHSSTNTTVPELEWTRAAEEIGQDGGVIGLFDVAHFQDVGVVPSNHRARSEVAPDDYRGLWYRFVCDILGDAYAITVPHGVVVHWDGGMDVDTCTKDDLVVGIRLSISGWPDAI